MRTEEDEPVYTYNDKYIRYFVRRSIKRDRVCSFNQYFKSKRSDDFLKIISKELNVTGIIYDIIEVYSNYKNKHFKIIEKEYENKFNDYRDIDEEKMEKYINGELSELTVHQILK